MHGQADDFRGQPIAHRHTTLAHRIMLVGLLPVQRDRIIDRRRNAFGLERSREPSRRPPATRMVYCAHTDVEPAGTVGDDRNVAKSFGITAGNAVARLDLVGEDLQLFDQDRGLDGVEARGETDADVVVLSLPWPCMRRLRKTSAIASSSVITAPPSP